MNPPLPWEREAIEAAIPHRAPFLLLDRVVERDGRGLTATWRVPLAAEWFRGHYPGQPVLPGALACEHVFQAAAVFISGELGGLSGEDGVPVLARIDSARFRRMVRPGEELTTVVRLEERVGPAWVLTGNVRCGAERVLQVRFVLSATGALTRATGDV